MPRASNSSRIRHGRRKREELPTLDIDRLPSSPSTFAAALSKVAVAQICLSRGYSAVEPSALRALSDIAARYIYALGRSAASVAAAHCRTDCNILDLARAIEDVNGGMGFAGAADPAGPPLRSGALKDLMAFVESVDEIPFPQRIRREEEPKAQSQGWTSFAAAGREPPRHVPAWLPFFPEGPWGRESKGEEIKWEEEGERMLAAAKLGAPAERGNALRWKPCEGVNSITPLEEKRKTVAADGEGGGEVVRVPAEREIVRLRLNVTEKKRLWLNCKFGPN